MTIVSYLLDAGAHIDDRDNRGRTALMIAAEGGHADIAGLLLARGADPSLKDKAGKRAADLTVLSSLRERLTGPRSANAAHRPDRYSASALRSSGAVASMRSDIPGLLPRARLGVNRHLFAEIIPSHARQPGHRAVALKMIEMAARAPNRLIGG